MNVRFIIVVPTCNKIEIQVETCLYKRIPELRESRPTTELISKRKIIEIQA